VIRGEIAYSDTSTAIYLDKIPRQVIGGQLIGDGRIYVGGLVCSSKKIRQMANTMAVYDGWISKPLHLSKCKLYYNVPVTHNTMHIIKGINPQIVW
jgi:hypothetical protein